MTLDAMKAVYCYCFPETRRILREVDEKLPDELFLVTTPVAELQRSIDSLVVPPLQLPATAQGHIDLDEIHVPIMERILSRYSSLAPGIGSFEHGYPTSGSSEGLFHLLTKLQVSGINTVNVLEGEYEGFGAQAKNLGMEVKEHPLETIDRVIAPGYWFISNPSARDGNILPDGLIPSLCDHGHKIVVDLAYAGATPSHPVDVSHPNILAAVLSFSKPYGTFRSRVGGFTLSRDGIPSLYGNKWFKDITRLFDALLLVERLPPGTLSEHYRPLQQSIVDTINEEHGLQLLPSDALLLAHLPRGVARGLNDAQRTLIEPFRRGPGYRFCLTPYFEWAERGGARYG